MAVTPGSVDRAFAPELRAKAAVSAVRIAPDGRAWVSGGFDEAGGVPVSDLLVLGLDGGVAREPLPGYLKGLGYGQIAIGNGVIPSREIFPLADGGGLIPTGAKGWQRLGAAGGLSGPAFPDQAVGEQIDPQFEVGGKLFVIRIFADGRRALEKRNSVDGSLDPAFAQSLEIPADPVDAVPGSDGKLWVMGTRPGAISAGSVMCPLGGVDYTLFRLDAAGAVDAGFPKKALASFRSHSLAAGPDGSVRVVMGPDQWGWNFWPSPTSSVFRIEFYGAAGNFQRREDFSIPVGTPFAWAENPQGKVVATGGDGRQFAWTGTGVWVASGGGTTYVPDHLVDTSFTSPGRVTSVRALPDGKWLVDGNRRLLPDGSDDLTWTDPRLDRPAENRELDPMTGGKMLVSGNFATVEGVARPWLTVLRANGTPDESFTLDPRVGEVRSAAVQGDVVFAVTAELVDYGNVTLSNLVKLHADGSLDESFSPNLSLLGVINFPSTPSTAGATLQLIGWNYFASVQSTIDGKILAETISSGGDVRSRAIHRLKPDGTRDGTFAPWNSYNRWGDMLALKNGKLWIGGEFLDENGAVLRDLTEDGVYLRPLCEWQGSVLFLEAGDGFSGRLKLWKGNSWVRGFAGPKVGTQNLVVAPGDGGTLHVQASFGGSRVMLRRLQADGRIDASFRAPLFESRQRREGEWFTLGESGRENYEPSAGETSSMLSAMLWSRESQRLWVAGGFNLVDGQPRDGIVRIFGGKSAGNTR